MFMQVGDSLMFLSNLELQNRSTIDWLSSKIQVARMCCIADWEKEKLPLLSLPSSGPCMQVGALSLLLSSLSLLLGRLFSSPGAIVHDVALFPTVVTCDLLCLSTACINKGKFGLVVNNWHLSSFRFAALKYVVGLMECTG